MKIVKELGLRFPNVTSKRQDRYVLVQCPKCVKEFEMNFRSLRQSTSTVCKSCSITEHKTTHGGANSRLYTIWLNMKARCYNEKSISYKNYGGRGITICAAWEDFSVFQHWAINNGYSKDLSIDRIKNDLGYYPENCRWATRLVQARNSKKIRSTNTSGYRGVSKHYSRYQAIIGMDNKLISLGHFDTAIEAAVAYDNFVIANNLEHTINNIHKHI